MNNNILTFCVTGPPKKRRLNDEQKPSKTIGQKLRDEARRFKRSLRFSPEKVSNTATILQHSEGTYLIILVVH